MKIVEFEDIWQKVQSNQPLSREDGHRLIRTNNLPELGFMANYRRSELHGRNAYYTHSINVNYTNICVLSCSFCAFAKKKKDPGAYLMTTEEIIRKTREAAEKGVWEVHIVGGLHADLPLSYYEDMMAGIKSACPGVLIQGFTAVELDFIARIEKIDVREVIQRLKDAGLGGIPGGGAEIFAEEPRKQVCETKITADRWLEVHQIAHELGFRSNATMLYGHVESPEDRVDHMLRLRKVQDETGGFLAFVPLAYQTENNQLNCPPTTGACDLRVLATSRLMLHNFDHIRQLWNYVDEKMIHVALNYGVDDLGGTNFNETIAKEAGSVESGFTHNSLVQMIRKCNYEPVEINSTYTDIKKDELVSV